MTNTEKLAAALCDAEAKGVQIEPPSQNHPGLGVDEAYAIQRLVVQRKLEADERVIGMKIGPPIRGLS